MLKIYLNKLKNYKFLCGIFIFLFSCVAPPEYSDGLLNNLPAIVNETDYFSLSVFVQLVICILAIILVVFLEIRF